MGLAACLTSCGQSISPDITAEEYAVFDRLLEERWNNSEIRIQLVVEDSTTDYALDRRRYRELVPEAERNTIANFERAIQQPATVEAHFDTDLSVVVADIDPLLKRNADEEAFGPWDRFHDTYPGAFGFDRFSRVGFNAARTQAMVYRSHHCGMLCGGGWLVLLVKADGRWSIATTARLWVS
jgi:hypothetical protein